MFILPKRWLRTRGQAGSRVHRQVGQGVSCGHTQALPRGCRRTTRETGKSRGEGEKFLGGDITTEDTEGIEEAKQERVPTLRWERWTKKARESLTPEGVSYRSIGEVVGGGEGENALVALDH
jgi:hypothetical protein